MNLIISLKEDTSYTTYNMPGTFNKLSKEAIRGTHNINSLKTHVTSTYNEIDRLQELVNIQSAEVLQLTTERQNQQLVHGTSYKLLINGKEYIITENNKKYNLYQTEQETSQMWHDQYQNILSH